MEINRVKLKGIAFASIAEEKSKKREYMEEKR